MSAELFINYRRVDTEWVARSLQTKFSDIYGEDAIFIDVDDITYGKDFIAELHEAINTCEVLLVIIGADWLTVEDNSGNRRIDNDSDLVRYEIKTALRRKIPIIPILINDTSVPTKTELPKDIQNFVDYNAITLRHASFQRDIISLEDAINEHLGKTRRDKQGDTHPNTNTINFESTTIAGDVSITQNGQIITDDLIDEIVKRLNIPDKKNDTLNQDIKEIKEMLGNIVNLQDSEDQFTIANALEEFKLGKTEKLQGYFTSQLNDYLILNKGTKKQASLAARNLGVLSSINSDIHSAIKNYEQSVSLDSSDPYTILQLGALYMRVGDFSNSEKYLNMGISKSESPRVYEALAIGYTDLGILYSKQGEYSKSEEQYNRVLKIVKNKKDLSVYLAKTYANMANLIYQRAEDKFKESIKQIIPDVIDLHKKALKIYIDNKYDLGIGLASGNLSSMYFQLAQYEQKKDKKELLLIDAEYHLHTAVEKFEDANAFEEVALSKGNLGNIYSEREMYDKARIFYNEALKMHEDNSPEFFAKTLVSIARIDMIEGNIDKAKKQYKDALAIYKDIHHKPEIRFVYYCLSCLYMKINDIEKAKEMQAMSENEDVKNSV